MQTKSKEKRLCVDCNNKLLAQKSEGTAAHICKYSFVFVFFLS